MPKRIVLTTYSKNERITDTINFSVPTNWLESWLKRAGWGGGIRQLLNEYTWDITWEIRLDAEREGVFKYARASATLPEEMYEPEAPVVESKWYVQDIECQLAAAGFEPSEQNVQRFLDARGQRTFLELLAAAGNEILSEMMSGIEGLTQLQK